MKLKIFTLHALLSFITLLILLITSINIINNYNKTLIESNLNQTLNITRNLLSSSTSSIDDTISETSKIICESNSNLRLTIIDKDGSVLYDSTTEIQGENHLNREEIKNLGTVVIRYSDTLHTNMMYLAQVSVVNNSTLYVRVALPMDYVNSAITSSVIISIIVFLIVLIITLLIDYKFIEYSMKPIKNDINRLNYLVTNNYLDTDKISIDSLSQQIDNTKELIETKINSLEFEKEKLNYIINTMKQGLIIVDLYMNVVLVNDYIRTLFNYTEAPYDTLLNITIMPEFNELFREALTKDSSKEFNLNNKHYVLYASKFKTKTLNINNEGVCFTLFDITDETNLKKAKSDFFANASHELKSPLTSIIGYSEMIKAGFITDTDEINASLDRILFEAKRMNDIVIEMLELSRLETNEKMKTNDNLSIKNTTLQVLKSFDQAINDKKIEVIITGDDFNTLISSEDLYTLIKNVLENAIRYNKNNGKIYIDISSTNKSLKIKDTGIGIPDKYRDRIWERFFRVDKARSRKLGGTGLGLSIVKYICINNEIKVDLDSKVDEYTTFTFTFKN